jgi:hypothetical protein
VLGEGEGVQKWLKCGTLHWRVGERHLPMRTLNKQGLQLQQVGRVVCWRKPKGHASRRTLNKQNLWGYISVKLTPEICNK